jgi:hypothetical protein
MVSSTRAWLLRRESARCALLTHEVARDRHAAHAGELGGEHLLLERRDLAVPHLDEQAVEVIGEVLLVRAGVGESSSIQPVAMASDSIRCASDRAPFSHTADCPAASSRAAPPADVGAPGISASAVRPPVSAVRSARGFRRA